MTEDEYDRAFAETIARGELAGIVAQDPNTPLKDRMVAIRDQLDCLQETVWLLQYAADGNISA